MSTLLESLASVVTPAVGPIAARLGETEGATARGLRTALATVLGGLLGKTRDPDFRDQIHNLITNAPPPATPPGEVPAMVDAAARGMPTTGAAGTLLSTVFAGKPGAVGDLLTRTAGLGNPASGPALLGVATPLAMDLLATKIREGGLSAAGMASLLGAEGDGIMAAAAPGLTNLLGTFTAAARGKAGEALGGVATATARVPGPAAQRGNRWLWPLLAATAVVLVWLAARGRQAPVVTPVAGAGASAAVPAGETAKTAAGEVAEVATGLGAFVKKPLPGGVTLNIPERGIESKLIAFIENESLPVTDTTWFDFDRLNFASGSSTILPASKEQVDNIVAILKAYPAVTVKIGGSTDNVGDAAANQRLSQRRADAVMKALTDAGIPASRVRAEGYDKKHPVADTSTEEGRARNRRIALEVTKK